MVKEGGTVEVPAPDFAVGTEVQVMVWVEEEEMNTTEYLLSTEANREHLFQSMRDAENPEKLTYVDVNDL